MTPSGVSGVASAAFIGIGVKQPVGSCAITRSQWRAVAAKPWRRTTGVGTAASVSRRPRAA